MAKDKYYKVLIDAKAKAPGIKTAKIKLEKMAVEQKKEFEETRAENKGKAAWLMPSGSIFWTSKGTEINNAKKIVFREEKTAKAKGKKTKAKRKK